LEKIGKAVLKYKGANLYLGDKHLRRHLGHATKIDLRTRHGNYPLGNKTADPFTVLSALSKIDSELKSENDVLVHCAAGRNRSPFLVACYIAKRNMVPFSKAVKIVKARYPKTHIEPELQRVGKWLFP